MLELLSETIRHLPKTTEAAVAEHMINEAMIHLARERLLRSGYLDAVRRICAEEPDLHYAISRYAVDALGSLEGLPSEAHDASHRAVWEAALLAVESYRLAHYRLWRGTELGALLERSDPSLADESGDDAGGDAGHSTEG